MTTYYTCWGSIRGCCGHAHTTYRGALRCLHEDGAGCASVSRGGYSDREVRILEDADELRTFYVTRGPGRPIGADDLDLFDLVDEDGGEA